MGKDIHAVSQKSRNNIRYRYRFLYIQNANKQLKHILPSTYDAKDKNFFRIVVVKAHAATAYVGIKKKITSLTDNLKC